ncbi:hypothetical protein DM02DRAFT_546063, partial [Periconia macrospinosa]
VKDISFTPDESYGRGIDLDTVEVCDDEHWTFVECDMSDPCRLCKSAHMDCIIIAVDRAFWNNGMLEANAALGIFIIYQSKFNDKFILT